MFREVIALDATEALLLHLCFCVIAFMLYVFLVFRSELLHDPPRALKLLLVAAISLPGWASCLFALAFWLAFTLLNVGSRASSPKPIRRTQLLDMCRKVRKKIERERRQVNLVFERFRQVAAHKPPFEPQ